MLHITLVLLDESHGDVDWMLTEWRDRYETVYSVSLRHGCIYYVVSRRIKRLLLVIINHLHSCDLRSYSSMLFNQHSTSVSPVQRTQIISFLRRRCWSFAGNLQTRNSANGVKYAHSLLRKWQCQPNALTSRRTCKDLKDWRSGP